MEAEEEGSGAVGAALLGAAAAASYPMNRPPRAGKCVNTSLRPPVVPATRRSKSSSSAASASMALLCSAAGAHGGRRYNGRRQATAGRARPGYSPNEKRRTSLPTRAARAGTRKN
ncbi:hypothetical protein EON68_01035 [archaeon]|nr:MAG: hypothetical protein EON68_01035 [archaeon]